MADLKEPEAIAPEIIEMAEPYTDKLNRMPLETQRERNAAWRFVLTADNKVRQWLMMHYVTRLESWLISREYQIELLRLYLEEKEKELDLHYDGYATCADCGEEFEIDSVPDLCDECSSRDSHISQLEQQADYKKEVE